MARSRGHRPGRQRPRGPGGGVAFGRCRERAARDALLRPLICQAPQPLVLGDGVRVAAVGGCWRAIGLAVGAGHAEQAVERSEEHTSELQSLMRISYAVFCLKKQINKL